MSENRYLDLDVAEVLPAVHTDFETAYIIDDYPYNRGGTLRTQMKVWVETRVVKKYNTVNQRVVKCTLNPKTGKWNKPKNGRYKSTVVLYLDSIGHLQSTGIYEGSEVDNAPHFLELFKDGVNDERTKFLDYHSIGHHVRHGDGISLFYDGKIMWYSRLNYRIKEAGRPDLAKHCPQYKRKDAKHYTPDGGEYVICPHCNGHHYIDDNTLLKIKDDWHGLQEFDYYCWLCGQGFYDGDGGGIDLSESDLEDQFIYDTPTDNLSSLDKKCEYDNWTDKMRENGVISEFQYTHMGTTFGDN